MDGIDSEGDISGVKFSFSIGNEGGDRNIMTNIEPDPGAPTFPEPQLRSEGFKVIPVEGRVFLGRERCVWFIPRGGRFGKGIKNQSGLRGLEDSKGIM